MTHPPRYLTVLIEDEKHQQERLRELIQNHFPQLEIGAIAGSVEDAHHIIQSIKPQLVFLDVLLPPATSFDLLQKLKVIDFEIIFTTSFEEFAVKAFQLSAVHYLIKPIVFEELEEAIQRFEVRMKKNLSHHHLQVLLNNLQLSPAQKKKIALPTLQGYTFVTIEEIIRCESDNTYTTFHLKDKRKIIVSRTLKECEGMLSDFSFFRVHNSNLVNLEYIVEYTKGEGGVIKMIDGSYVDVSRRRKDDFVRMFNRIG